MYGYIDRDGDGWREQPDGQPLVLEYSTQPDQQSRQLIEQWKKNMHAIGIRIEFKTAKWPENLKASRAGKLMMWGVGWSAGAPDGDTFLALGTAPTRAAPTMRASTCPLSTCCTRSSANCPTAPSACKPMDEAKKLMVAYMPYKVHVHRIFTDMAHPWVQGYHRNIFVREFFKYVDLDPADRLRQGVQLRLEALNRGPLKAL
jgi:hypothetical protein